MTISQGMEVQEMKYVDLNNTELNVSRICLGTAGFGEKLNEEEMFLIPGCVCSGRRKFY